MKGITITDRYLAGKYAFFKWRYNLVFINKLGLALAMAFFTGLMAQIRIYLPFSPVPITGQVFAVLLSGVVCGGAFGSLSQIMYIGLGFAGLGWFAAFSPSSGYLLASPTGRGPGRRPKCRPSAAQRLRSGHTVAPTWAAPS